MDICRQISRVRANSYGEGMVFMRLCDVIEMVYLWKH